MKRQGLTGELIAEVFGTFILILLGDGVVANVLLAKTKGNNSGWIVITTAWGMAVFVGAYASGSLSGAHLNPAVTLGLAIAGNLPWSAVPRISCYRRTSVGIEHIRACAGRAGHRDARQHEPGAGLHAVP